MTDATDDDARRAGPDAPVDGTPAADAAPVDDAPIDGAPADAAPVDAARAGLPDDVLGAAPVPGPRVFPVRDTRPRRGVAGEPRGRRRALPAILLLAALLRVVYAVQLADEPELRQHLATESDMAFFDEWARLVAGGDLLLDRSLHPRHSWRVDMAKLWFSWHPEARAELADEAAARGVPAEHLLLDRWFGGKRYHHEPLYPYALAALHVLGDGVALMLLVQMLLGVASVWLVHRITARAFGRRAAVAAALLATLCGPLMLYDLVLLRATAIITAGLLVVDRADVALRRDTRGAWIACGLACGVAMLIKTTIAPVVMGLGAYLVLRRRAFGHAAVLAAACGVCLLPVFARNVAVGAPVFSLTSMGGDMMLLNNSAGAQASLSGFTPNLHTMARVHGEADGDDGAIVRGSLASLGDTPVEAFGAFLGLCRERFLHVFHAYEIPNNVNTAVYRRAAPVLRWTFVDMAVLAPLGLLGLWLARRRRCGPALWFAATALVPIVGMGILARYRLPFMVALIPFAGFAVDRGLRAWARGGAGRATAHGTRSTGPGLLTTSELSHAGGARVRVAVVALAALAFGLVVARPLPDDVPEIRESDYVIPWAAAVSDDVDAAEARGDAATAAATLERFLRRAPPELDALVADVPAPHPREGRLAQFFAPLYTRWAGHLEALGETARAAEARRTAQRFESVVRATWPSLAG